MDYSKMTKQQLIEYIESLNEDQTGKYGLIWDKEKEPEKIVVDCDKYIPILAEDRGKSINNKGVSNILIEGDNFHSLSVLNYTHKESIDVIYIDPPYNTGNKDFIYNDKYVDLNDGYRHSKWLNFMEKRLRIAKELLKDTGAIFISIDYHEYAQLKLLCDKVFDESNYLETIIQNKGNAQNDATDIQHNHEYILVYRKKLRTLKKNNKNVVLPTLMVSSIEEKEVLRDEKGYYYMTGSFTTGSAPTLNERPYMGWTIYYNPKTGDKIGRQDYDVDLAKFSNDEDKIYSTDKKLLNLGYDIIRAPKKKNKLGRWSWGLETFEANKENVIIKETKTGYSISVKKYVNEDSIVERDGKYYSQDLQENNIKSIIDYSSAYGTTVLNDLVDTEEKFNNPKNPNMIKYFISLIPNKDAIVLDFFAGSGTTAQAVMELNKEDGGHRQFILCTNNENNICENFTYPRIINAMNKIGDNSSLHYYKTDFVDYSGTRDQLYYNLTEKCVPMLCVKSDTYELIEKNNEYAIYSNKDKTEYSCVYFDIFGESYNKFIEKVKSIKEHKNLYIFSLSEYVNEENFKGITNYSLEPIPYKILDLYKNVVKMSKEN